MADLKVIYLISGTDTHDTRVVIHSLEDFIAVTLCPLSTYFEKFVETQYCYYEPNYARLLVNPLNLELSKEKLLKPVVLYNALNL